MKVTLKFVGLAVVGTATKEAEPVAQRADSTMRIELAHGARVSDLIDEMAELGVPKKEISMILVNGDEAGARSELHNGDAVTIMGEVPGM
jgi:phage-related minor tail protein